MTNVTKQSTKLKNAVHRAMRSLNFAYDQVDGRSHYQDHPRDKNLNHWLFSAVALVATGSIGSASATLITQATAYDANHLSGIGTITVPGTTVSQTTPISKGNLTTSLTESWWNEPGHPFRSGAFAYAKEIVPTDTNGSFALAIGTSALAKSWGGLGGVARSAAFIDYVINVDIVPVFPVYINPCGAASICTLATSFLHETHGLLARSAIGTVGQMASIDEQISISASYPSPFSGLIKVGQEVVGGGSAVLSRDPQNGSFVVSTSGQWTQNDLLAFEPTSSTVVGLFLNGDPRNSLIDETGDLLGYQLSHLQLFDVPADFKNYGTVLTSSYILGITQVAEAIHPIGGYDFTTTAANFANTSTFVLESIAGPNGPLDPSQFAVHISLLPLDNTTVAAPEPAAWTVFMGYLVLLGRRMYQRKSPVCDFA